MKNRKLSNQGYYDGDIVNTEVDGKPANLRISVEAKKITVTLLSVRESIECSCIISPSSPLILTESVLHGSKTNEFGTYKVNELIRKLISNAKD